MNSRDHVLASVVARPSRDPGQAAASNCTRLKYRRWAETYDRTMDSPPLRVARRRLIARLGLRPGAAVIDVACGTGANFPWLEAHVGEAGRIVGVDLSPDMLAGARARAKRGGWRNVELIGAPVEEATLESELDAAVFSFAHDVTRSPRAIDNVFASLKPGARVAAIGAKWAPRPALPVNILVWALARRAVTTFEGFGRPWSLLVERAPGLQVSTIALGCGYVASGNTPRERAA